MSTARCASCSTLRPANSSFCPTCGLRFEGRAPTRFSVDSRPGLDDEIQGQTLESLVGRLSVDVSVWTGVKLGVGFAIGATLVGLIGWAIFIVVLGVGIQGLSR